MSAHIIQRGNNKIDIFRESADYQAFLGFLARALTQHRAAVHAYALMTTHVHIIATPGRASSLPKAMQQLEVQYVRFFNDKYERTGTLWDGRYRAFLLTDERYWMTCLKYVEQNPVRAAMVAHPGDYRWSSYGAHARGDWPHWLTPHHLYQSLGATKEARESAYRALCAAPLPDDELAVIRQPLRVGGVSDTPPTPPEESGTMSVPR